MRRDLLLDRVGQVLQQVPAIGDLNCVWCRTRGGLRIGAATIPADDLDAGMGVKPRSLSSCLCK
jgi:hypothetical protein